MKLLRPADVAELLGVSVGHVYRLVGRRSIPHVKIGGAVRFRPEALERWIGRHEIGSVPFARGRSGPGQATRGPAGHLSGGAEG